MLPPPNLVQEGDRSALHVSTVGQLPRHLQPDPDTLPRLFTMSWLVVPAATADAILRHYDEHPCDVFVVTLRGGQQVRLQIRSRPVVQWATVFATVTAEAEEVLAYE
ncbi:MAG: hypothetical protein JNK15_03125 [Planctomycetes bacterium]|nr:hypothetical protein [Planctomycetota bacterium]